MPRKGMSLAWKEPRPLPSLQKRNQNRSGFGDLAVGFDEFVGGGMQVWGVKAEAFAEFGLKK
jgi:hypothetical protein